MVKLYGIFVNRIFSRRINQYNYIPFNLFDFIRTAKKETSIIDCSTIDIRTSKEMYQIARNKQLHFVDAPVSGG